jgi:hypothetical protein
MGISKIFIIFGSYNDKSILEMRFRIVKTTLATLLIAVCFTALANDNQPRVKAGGVVRNARKEAYKASNTPKVSTEFGLGVGARYNFQFNVTPLCENFTPKLTMPVSYGAALQFRLNIGRSFGIQPEISYARNQIKITDHQDGKEINVKAKSNIVQIPMLLSFRAAMFRFNFGPVFTLMDEATYQLADASDESIKQMPIGRLFPTVTYTAGISVKFAKVLMLDLRYADQFRGSEMDKIDKRENQWVWTLDTTKQPKAQTFRTTSRNVQLRFGVVF